MGYVFYMRLEIIILITDIVHRTIPEWNVLPAHIAEADSVTSFKARLAKPAVPSD